VAALRWLTIAGGLVIALLALGRMLDARPLITRRWPGNFASGTPLQRRQVFGLLGLGFGLAALGASELTIDWSRPLATVLLVVSLLIFAATIFVFARVLVARE
jgi:hypothetical protein